MNLLHKKQANSSGDCTLLPPLGPLLPLGRCSHPLVYFLRPRLFGEPSPPCLSLPAPEKPWSLLQGGISIFSLQDLISSVIDLFSWLISLHQQSVFCTWITQSSPLSLLFSWHPWFSYSWVFPVFFLLFPPFLYRLVLYLFSSLLFLDCPRHGSWMTSTLTLSLVLLLSSEDPGFFLFYLLT